MYAIYTRALSPFSRVHTILTYMIFAYISSVYMCVRHATCPPLILANNLREMIFVRARPRFLKARSTAIAYIRIYVYL